MGQTTLVGPIKYLPKRGTKELKQKSYSVKLLTELQLQVNKRAILFTFKKETNPRCVLLGEQRSGEEDLGIHSIKGAISSLKYEIYQELKVGSPDSSIDSAVKTMEFIYNRQYTTLNIKYTLYTG